MAVIPKFQAKVHDSGALAYVYPKAYTEHVKTLAGKVVNVTIKPVQAAKTMPQLAYFHGPVCQIISNHTGYTIEEVKGVMKHQFLKKVVQTPKGELEIIRSLADLTKMEMMEFIDKCIMLAAQHWSLDIPSPNEDKIAF